MVGFEPLEARTVLTAGPVITEFLAVNDSSLNDGDGNASDWIEIHNPTSSMVSLDGWHLTDDQNDLEKWTFPSDSDKVELDAGEYLVVFASGQDTDDYIDAEGNLHTNFRLSGSGEDLLLVEPDGVTYDPRFLDYPSQSADVSYGVSIDGITEALVAANSPLSYRVPSAGENPTAWTAVNFDESGFTNQQTVAGAGLIITEVDTGDEKKFVELQNVSSETIDTSGWRVAINAPAAGVNAVVGTTWNLPAVVSAEDILYRTDQTNDSYWGSAIPWEVDGDGWVMIVDDAGQVQDFVAWGYTGSEIASININVGPHVGVAVGEQWSGDSAEVGMTGVVTQPIEVGSGADMAGANGVDSAGIRLNIEPNFVQSLDAGTYDVQEIAFAANSNGNGQLRSFLAVRTNTAPTYQIIWASDPTRPASGDSIHRVNYPAGTEQFTLAADADVYAGVWHDGAAKVRFSTNPTTTNHDNSPSVPMTAGQTIGGFSHGNLRDRTYAYHITVGSGGGATSTLARTGNVDGDTANNFFRSHESSLGEQNDELASIFGGVVPTISGIGLDGGDPAYKDLIQTDLSEVIDSSPSVWTRFEFETADLTSYDELTLRARYDDGFQAYLDGVPLVSRNATAVLSATSAAISARPNNAAIEFEDIDISAALGQLTAGNHVLAVHMLNSSPTDSDLVFQPELLVKRDGVAQFFADATPGEASTANGFNTVDDTKFSVDRGFYDAPINVEISTETIGATIVYTLDGSSPTVNANGEITNGSEYVTPLLVNSTTTLRAMAFKSGLAATDVDTHTYLFTQDIAEQTREATIASGFPSSWGGRSADYGMDPDVVGPNDDYDGVYADSIADDLKSLPALSLVLDVDDMFGSSGIYSNIGGTGVAWERPVSAELFFPDGQQGFQVNAGIRTHGGASRSLSRKNSFRLLFKDEYGPTKLNYPLFGDGVDRFDTIVLRSHFNDGWGWDGAGSDPLFTRDEFHRQTQAAMGHTASRGTNVHLYINGIYWGIYNPSERPDASFGAEHIGGDKTEWDARNHGGVVDGTSSTWNTMQSLASSVRSASSDSAKLAAYQRLQGNDASGNNDPNRESYLDIENYVDYLLLSFYTGNDDWPTNNWYAARQRGADSEGFQFFAWDSEISMDLSGRTHLNENVISDANANAGGAAQAYGSLRRYEEFQLAVADRVHEHFFNGGVFYVDPNNPNWDPAHPERNRPAARMVQIADVIEDAIVAESARWGDQHRGTPYTRNAEWQSELNHLLNTFFPQRTGIVMNQLRAQNFYPDTDAPEFEVNGTRQHGGTVAVGSTLGFDNPNGAGTIWYTTDGTDPRLPGGSVNSASATQFTSPIGLSSFGTVKARVLQGGEWSALTSASFSFDQSGLVVSEVNYNPATPTAAELAIDPGFENDDFEFIELVNAGSSTVDLTGVQFVDGLQFDFSAGAVQQLAAGERVVVVSNTAAFSARYGGMPVTIAGESPSSLSNGGESITLVGVLGNVLSEFEYNDNWYDLTDGGGHSLTLRDPANSSADLSSAVAWRPSNLPGGTPGSVDSAVDPGAVVINELLATRDDSGWLELHNTTASPVNISHWYLSDDEASLQKYQFAAGTIVPANGFLVVDERTRFGVGSVDAGSLTPFTLNRTGGALFLTGGDGAGRLLGYRESQNYTGTQQNVSLGVYEKSTGATDFVQMSRSSAGSVNADPIVGPLVINEVMYHPRDGASEYLELRNISDREIAFGDSAGSSWRLRGAIEFDLPNGRVIPAGGYALVVQSPSDGAVSSATEAAAFRSANNVDQSVPVFVYTATDNGSLNNDGEKIFLERSASDLAGAFAVLDSVKFNDAAPWPTEPDGSGPSLSRLDPEAYGNDVANWSVSTGSGTPGRDNLFEDVTPPTMPGDLVGRIVTSTTASIAWTAAEDPQSGVALYRIYRNGTLVGTSLIPRFTDATFQFSVTGQVRYHVSAVNGDNVEGELSTDFVDFSAGVASFQDGVAGYTGTRDAELREVNADANNGLTDTVLEVDGQDGGGELAVIIRWEDLEIPQGSVVVGASASFNVTNQGHAYDAHQVTRDWNEGEVTWNAATSAQDWAVGGANGPSDRGDQIGRLEGGANVVEFNAAGIDVLNSWLNTPGSNFGILISNPGNSTDGVDFSSRETAIASQRPKLDILYAPMPSPPMTGDFTLDDAVDAADIDLLVTAIKAGATDQAFDLNSDDTIDRNDLDHLVREILATEYGDANLDGVVDGLDFTTWSDHRFETETGWSQADFNGDRLTDGSDFNLWNQHKFANAPDAADDFRLARIPRPALHARSAAIPIPATDTQRAGITNTASNAKSKFSIANEQDDSISLPTRESVARTRELERRRRSNYNRSAELNPAEFDRDEFFASLEGDILENRHS